MLLPIEGLNEDEPEATDCLEAVPIEELAFEVVITLPFEEEADGKRLEPGKVLLPVLVLEETGALLAAEVRDEVEYDECDG